MKRTGKGAANIFASTAPAKRPKGTPASSTPAPATTPRGRGRPFAHDEPTTKATTILYNRQITQIDRLSTDVRERSGRVLNRADIIRAILDAVLTSKIDLTVATSEEDVRRIVTARLTD